MKCLLRYQWVKLPRNALPQGKGVMGYWAKLASRAAFRAGKGKYCGHTNSVSAGSWAGGMVGIKSIMGVRSKDKAKAILSSLSDLGYLAYQLDQDSKKLTYSILDWVKSCSGEPCSAGAVYATEGYGFLCVPRSLTGRLVAQHHTFDDADAFLDLWCHTVWCDAKNTLSYAAPLVQFGRHGIALTLDTLGRRWNWEKTKVWRFFHKYEDAYALHKLPGSYGCLIVNKKYPDFQYDEVQICAEIKRFLSEIRFWGQKTFLNGPDNHRINRLIVMYSAEHIENEPPPVAFSFSENRVALSPLYKRAYFSDCWNCINTSLCLERGLLDRKTTTQIRGPCQNYGPRFNYGGIL